MLGRRPHDPLIETVLVQDGRIRLLERHLTRLKRSGASSGQVTAVRTLAQTWCATAHEPTVVRFDLVAGRGVASAARRPGSTEPVRLVVVPGYDPSDRSREQKRAARSWAAAAENAATTQGADLPLLVSPDDQVGESTRANLFVIDAERRLHTPPARGLLPGVTRAWVIEEAAAAQTPLSIADLVSWHAAFLTTAGRGIVPVASIDGHALAEDPRIGELQAAWRALP